MLLILGRLTMVSLLSSFYALSSFNILSSFYVAFKLQDTYPRLVGAEVCIELTAQAHPTRYLNPKRTSFPPPSEHA